MADKESKSEILQGAVVRAHGRLFWVKTGKYILQCAIRENIKSRSDSKLSPVVVGDFVDLEALVDLQSAQELIQNQPQAVITAVHPRKSKFSRPKRGNEDMEQVVAANIEQLVIISSVARPRFKLGLIDRFLIAAHQGSLKPIIVINKIDLVHTLNLDHLDRIYSSINVALIKVSATESLGLEKLADVLKDKLSIVIGQSGVGKSSLLNAIEKTLNIRVGEVSEATQKGIHTTTAVQMYPLSQGGFVVDTPGLKYMGLWDIEADDLRYLYPEINALSGKCRFRNCKHGSEPGCAVKHAVEEQEIFPERYESYLKLLQELETAD